MAPLRLSWGVTPYSMEAPFLMASSALPRGQSLSALIAATLCYVWGAVLLWLGVAVMLPIFSRHRFAIAAALFPLVVLTIAVTYVVSGYLIAQRRRIGAWFGVTVAVLTALVQGVLHLDIMWISLTPIWLAVNALLLGLLLTNWRRFHLGAPRNGP